MEAVKHLEKMRINPNLLRSQKAQRDDLEFYIPQICSAYLDPRSSQQFRDRLEIFLLHASKCSFFFAHRLWFFFNSNSLTRETSSRLEGLIEQIQKAAIESNELLYIANSDILLKAVVETKQEHLINSECVDQFKSRKSSKKLLKDDRDQHNEPEVSKFSLFSRKRTQSQEKVMKFGKQQPKKGELVKEINRFSLIPRSQINLQEVKANPSFIKLMPYKMQIENSDLISCSKSFLFNTFYRDIIVFLNYKFH